MEDQDVPLKAKASKTVTKKALYTVYFVAFLDLFAVSMLAPLLRKQALATGNSYTTAGIIGSVYGAMQLFSSPVVGDWSDRFGRRRVMVLSTLFAAIGYLLLAMSEWLPIVFVARSVSGAFKHTQTLTKAYLADLGHTGHAPTTSQTKPTQTSQTEPTQTSQTKPTQTSQTPTQTSQTRQSISLGSSFGSFMAISTSGFILGPIVGGHLAEHENGFKTVSFLVAAIFF